MQTYKEFTDYLRKHYQAFNISEMARRIDCSKVTLWHAIHDRPGTNGYRVKIPDRCLPLLAAYFRELGIIKEE